MENANFHDQQKKLISTFLEIAVGHTMETAIQCLTATSWNLEDAINLFLIHKRNPSLSYQNPTHQKEQFSLDLLPSRMDTLYDSSMYQRSVAECCHDEDVWNLKQEPSDSDSRLSPLYRLPQNLRFNGSFEDAKLISSRENLWLLVNLQSLSEFACHTLNRDLWSNDAVSQAIESSFVLFQINDHTMEGQTISSFYKIEACPPVILLIDPITGQKMRTWSGVIEPQSFLEDLMKYIDAGPHQHIASQTSNKRTKTEKLCFESNHTDDQDNHIDHVVMETCSSSNLVDHNCLKFPVLTEEPKGDCDRTIVCSVCIRFPDGRRKQRKFLKTEPIQLLWSFCYSHMEESANRSFKLVQAIPGALKTLDYGDNATLDQSGLDNSMISVTWD